MNVAEFMSRHFGIVERQVERVGTEMSEHTATACAAYEECSGDTMIMFSEGGRVWRFHLTESLRRKLILELSLIEFQR